MSTVKFREGPMIPGHNKLRNNPSANSKLEKFLIIQLGTVRYLLQNKRRNKT
jgi:hypothetical protein